MMYKKDDIHCEIPYSGGELFQMWGKSKPGRVYLSTGAIGANYYVIGFKEQVQKLITDLTLLLPSLED